MNGDQDPRPVVDWTDIRPVPVPFFESVATQSPKPYTPVLSTLERRAYEAAHKIIDVQPQIDLALPSARRVSYVDRIAKIIMQTMDGGLDPDGRLDATRKHEA